MKNKTILLNWIVLSIFSLLLIGCAQNATFESPSATISSQINSPTRTIQNTAVTIEIDPTNTPIITTIESPTTTPSPVHTNTMEPQETATLAPIATPTPYLVMPGFYRSGGCAVANLVKEEAVRFCVTSVTVKPNRSMVFSVSWQIVINEQSNQTHRWKKRSDEGNRNMYLLDNLGNRYDHIYGGGAAYAKTGVSGGGIHEGWFEFPSPPAGAITFYFYDDDLKQVIRNIYLIQPEILLGEFPLPDPDIRMDFLLEKWKLANREGKSILQHEAIPECEIEQMEGITKRGQLKNTTQIGSVIYDIFGSVDADTKAQVRDYWAKTGLGEITPDLYPAFTLNIPEDDLYLCILAASEVFATLEVRQAPVIPTSSVTTPLPTPTTISDEGVTSGATSTPETSSSISGVKPGFYLANGCDLIYLAGDGSENCILNIA